MRDDPVLLLNNLSASFLSLLQESLSRKGQRELTAVVPHFFSSTSQEGSSSLLLPSPQQLLLPPELTHSLTHSKAN
jgi:hypothetical protein